MNNAEYRNQVLEEAACLCVTAFDKSGAVAFLSAAKEIRALKLATPLSPAVPALRKLTNELTLKEIAAEFAACAEYRWDCTISSGVCEMLFSAMTTPPAVPEPAPLAPSYPEGEVVGACVCGSWPGGKCLKCAWIPAPQVAQASQPTSAEGKDSERLDWLEQSSRTFCGNYTGSGFRMIGSDIWHGTLREAIDGAAMCDMGSIGIGKDTNKEGTK